MTNEALTILLQCGLFFIAFLELIIGLIDKFTKKNSSPTSQLDATSFL